MPSDAIPTLALEFKIQFLENRQVLIMLRGLKLWLDLKNLIWIRVCCPRAPLNILRSI